MGLVRFAFASRITFFASSFRLLPPSLRRVVGGEFWFACALWI